MINAFELGLDSLQYVESLRLIARDTRAWAGGRRDW